MQRAAANPFTHAEKSLILRYIVDNDSYHRVKGNAVWKEMAEQFPTHTWQSLKEHFKKRLFPMLRSPDFQLTNAEIENFRLGFRGVLPNRNKKTVKNKGGTSGRFYKILSDEDDKEVTGDSGTNEKSKQNGVHNSASTDNPPTMSSCAQEGTNIGSDKNKSSVVNSLEHVNIESSRCNSDSSDGEYVTVDEDIGKSVNSIDFDSDETNIDSDDCVNSYILGL